MCGIAGFFGNDTEQTLVTMTRSLAHRGPNDEGFYIHNAVGLGHRRLSIIDTSSAGKQPITDPSGRYTIIFNGELYNYKELRPALESSYNFTSNSDTEVLLAAYKAEGSACVKKFIGMFAFVIYDKEQNTLFGARDHVGIKPLYYTIHNQTLYFASEIKALLTLPIQKIANNARIVDYLADGNYDHTNETFFAHIQKIPAGHTFTWKQGVLTTEQFWNVADAVAKEQPRSFEETQEALLALAEDAVKLQLRSDVPIGINLSGGFDSGALLALANKQHGGAPITAFSMLYDDATYSEEKTIAITLEHQKNPWQTSTLHPDELFTRGHTMIADQDEPFGGVPTIAYQKLAEHQSHSPVKVLLEGQGADESCAGYGHHVTAYYRDILTTLDLSNMNTELHHLKKKLGSTPAALLKFWNLAGRPSSARHYDLTRHTRPEAIAQDYLTHNQQETIFIKPFDNNLQNALYQDLMYTKLPRVLRFNDHATMKYGLELRVPFLDHRLISFLMATPSNFKIKKGQGKYIFRKTMSQLLPRSNIGNTKRSVVSPQTEWFKTYAQKNITEILLSEKFLSRSWINPDVVRSELTTFFTKPAENSFFIWQWINLHWWFETFID